ncbi:MAG: hypothetical protein IIC95_02015 [Chloroflexi bacterium]|nr:hypothetical protein [Chloroflexota bacterium]MCH7654745.1 hypothetical protein [Chloroflexota bacterium]
MISMFVNTFAKIEFNPATKTQQSGTLALNNDHGRGVSGATPGAGRRQGRHALEEIG